MNLFTTYTSIMQHEAVLGDVPDIGGLNIEPSTIVTAGVVIAGIAIGIEAFKNLYKSTIGS